MTSRKKPWLIVLTASLFFFYAFIQLNLFNAIDIELMQAFHINAAKLGELSSMYFYANAIFLFPAGILVDRFSPKKMLLLASLCSAVGTILFGLAHDYAFAAVSRFIIGFGAAFCFVGCVRLASRWFPSQRMAFVTGVIVTMAMLGGLVAQTPFALLSHSIGWRQAILLDGAFGIIVFLAIALIVRDRPHHLKESAATEKADLKNLGFWKSLKLVLLNPQNWLGGIYTSLLNLPVFLLGALWGIHYLVSVHHLPQLQASYATTLFFLGIIIGCPTIGWLSDTMGRRVLPMQLGAISTLIVMLILMYMPGLSLVSLMTLFFFIGLFSSAQVLSYPTISELNPPILTGTAVSIDSTTIMVSGVIFQPLFGLVMEWGWNHAMANGVPVYSPINFNHAMWMMPISFVVAFMITFFIRETYCKQQV